MGRKSFEKIHFNSILLLKWIFGNQKYYKKRCPRESINSSWDFFFSKEERRRKPPVAIFLDLLVELDVWRTELWNCEKKSIFFWRRRIVFLELNCGKYRRVTKQGKMPKNIPKWEHKLPKRWLFNNQFTKC